MLLLTCMTLIFRPVSAASCSRICLVGFGVAANAALRTSSCLALIVVRGPLLLLPLASSPTELPSSLSLPEFVQPMVISDWIWLLFVWMSRPFAKSFCVPSSVWGDVIRSPSKLASLSEISPGSDMPSIFSFSNAESSISSVSDTLPRIKMKLCQTPIKAYISANQFFFRNHANDYKQISDPAVTRFHLGQYGFSLRFSHHQYNWQSDKMRKVRNGSLGILHRCP